MIKDGPDHGVPDGQRSVSTTELAESNGHEPARRTSQGRRLLGC